MRPHAITSPLVLQVDPDTYDMLKTLNMANLPGVEKVTVSICGPCLVQHAWAAVDLPSPAYAVAQL